MRRTKLIGTLGPASSGPEVLDALIAAGLDVARLNASHGTQTSLAAQLAAVREAATRAGRHVAVMVDLGGAKLRLGEVAPGTALVAGERFALRSDGAVGDAAGASVSYAGLAHDLSVGDRLLIDDGKIELTVTGTAPGVVETVVVTGGALGSRKGVNVPGVSLGMDGITDRDFELLAWALDAGVDLVAQSFVRSAADVERLRTAMGERAVPIVAKIEKHEAVADLQAIIEAADAVMVARGDLGVELPLEEVPAVQRRIVAGCRAAGKPVVVATQMLESMTTASTPTRAEVSDVANAIFDAVDAVMLSGETAMGVHPAHVVATMDRIIRSAEGVHAEQPWTLRRGAATDVAGAVSHAVGAIAGDLELACIVTATQTGATARSVAARRPTVPVLAITPDEVIARRLSLVWGVQSCVVAPYSTIDEMIAAAAEAARDTGLARSGDLVAITGGVAMNVAGSTNFVQVHRV